VLLTQRVSVPIGRQRMRRRSGGVQILLEEIVDLPLEPVGSAPKTARAFD
jgi:hypothetical protein